MTTKSAIEMITDMAIMENQAMKGYYASYQRKKEISENGTIQPFFLKKVVSISERPVSLDTFTNYDPDVKCTNGWYSIRYNPVGSTDHVKGKPWTIGQDLVCMKVSVSGVRHWHCLCRRIPELGWIERNSTLTDAMFGIAKKHPGMSFGFNVDWVKYCDKIEKKAAELGIDIDHKAFVTYRAKKEVIQEINDTHKLAKFKTKEDYEDVLKEIDNEFQEEMRSNETTSDND